MPEEKMATEVAEQEFERFLDAMDLASERDSLTGDDLESLQAHKSRMVDAMRKGKLVIDDYGQPVFTPTDGEPITFYEPTGASFMAMDQSKDGQNIHKMIAYMADMTRTSAATFSKMKERDFKVCRAVVLLFLPG